MKLKTKILIGTVFFNEAVTINHLLPKYKSIKLNLPYFLLFLDDGSTDKTPEIVENFLKNEKIKDAKIISNNKNKGVGAAIRKIIEFGLKNKFDICVIMAGNGKDDPSETPILVNPVLNENYDYIQGSRFLEGGSFKNLPFLRKLMIKGFTTIMFLFTGFKCTDATNGFRAYKFSLFKDKRINLNQNWLDRYELETYLHTKVITLGYKIKEVPVSKNYIPGVKKYSKIRPIIDWWKLARPVFLLKFGLKY